MDYEIKINRINDAVEMLDEKEAYYQLEKVNGVNFDIMFINKIINAEIENSKNKEKDAKNVKNDIEKSILELNNMEKNKINEIETTITDTIKKVDGARIEKIKNLEEIRIEIAYKKRIGYRNKNFRE